MSLTLRADLVLVKLPPQKDAPKVALIGTDLDTWLAKTGIEESQQLLKRPVVQQPTGVVVQVGHGTHDVWPGDVVLLEPEAGQPIDVCDPQSGLPIPHLIVREADISAVLSSKGTV